MNPPEHPIENALLANQMNKLILHFLRETGKIHSAFTFKHESSVNYDGNLKPGRLQSLIEKGIVMEALENESRKAFKLQNKDVLLYKKKRNSRTRALLKLQGDGTDDVFDLKNYISSRIQLELKNLKKKINVSKNKSKEKVSEENKMSVEDMKRSVTKSVQDTSSINFKKSFGEYISTPMILDDNKSNGEFGNPTGDSLKDLGISLQNNALGNNSFSMPGINDRNSKGTRINIVRKFKFKKKEERMHIKNIRSSEKKKILFLKGIKINRKPIIFWMRIRNTIWMHWRFWKTITMIK
jgi:hypothetical protein